ncbi:MAG: phosphate signaling complex protein PhoU [Candidatus Nanopelagicales bacterium]|nr:phosphate signaling complex protein PhoU [Candidatus Nanopelagicales bacterium]
MRTTYHEELEDFDEKLVELTRLVDAAMLAATQSLLDADLSKAEAVIAGDDAIDVLAADLEDRALNLVALQAPVATELRVLLSGLRISASLERMGDLATHVAKATRMRYPAHAVPAELRGIFIEMGSVAERIVRRTGEVLSERDVPGAEGLAAMDDDMDRLHRELFQAVLDPTWPYGIEAAVDITLLSRYYERFADHAVTIGMRVVHIVTGEPYVSRSAS